MSGKRAKANKKALASVVDMTPRTGPVPSLEYVEAILSYEGIYEAAKAIPAHGPVGRPRDYPDYMFIVWEALISVYRSSRRVETELSHPLVWNHVRRIVRERFPNDRSMWLPAEPMKRHHYRHACRYLRDADLLGTRMEIFRAQALEVAFELGLLDPNGPGSATHPDLSRTIQADGKVVTSLFKAKPGDFRIDKETGEVIPRRADPDGHLNIEGDGVEAWGTKFVLVAARTEEFRAILDIAHVPASGEGGEAGVATELIARLAKLAPGTQAVNYDGAMRGMHIDTLIRAGLILVVPPRAARVVTKGGKQVTKTHGNKLIETREIKLGTKTVTIELHAVNGALHLRELNDLGKPEFSPLKRIRIQVPGNTDGTFRMYTQCQLPKHLGGKIISVRNYTNDEDRKRGLNRTEYLRPIPPDDPDFARLYARRKDIESINRSLEDTLYLNRAHSVGHVAQQADLLGFALMTNALSLHRHRKRQGAEAAA